MVQSGSRKRKEVQPRKALSRRSSNHEAEEPQGRGNVLGECVPFLAPMAKHRSLAYSLGTGPAVREFQNRQDSPCLQIRKPYIAECFVCVLDWVSHRHLTQAKQAPNTCTAYDTGALDPFNCPHLIEYETTTNFESEEERQPR